MPTAALLEVDHLCVNFGPSRVVDRVSFTVDAGEKFGLVGESGSGKSVTALSVLRLVDGGDVRGRDPLPGEDVLAKSERADARLRGSDIAMIFQEPMTALNPLYSVGSQIAEVLELHEGLRPKAGAREGDRDAGADRHSRAGAPRRGVSAPAVGRPASARDDRDGAGLQSEAADRRRADHRAGRDHPGADPRAARRPAARVRHGDPVHHPRPQPRAALHASRRRDGAWPAGRAGRHRARCSPGRSIRTRSS